MAQAHRTSYYVNDAANPFYSFDERRFLWGCDQSEGYLDDVASESCGPVFECYGRWFELYRQMNEFELLYLNAIMSSKEFDQGEQIVVQGSSSQRLYFINSGVLKKSVIERGCEITGESLGKGDLAGIDGFFDEGISPYSVYACEGVRVDYIEKDDLEDVRVQAPGIYLKLKEFGMTRGHRNVTGTPISEKRSHRRFQLSGMTAANLLDDAGIPEGKPFRGELMDVSEGGFAFMVKLRGDTAANRLMGRTVVSLIKIQGAQPGNDIFWSGRIVDVCKREKGVYSLHLKGDGVSYPMARLIHSLGGH